MKLNNLDHSGYQNPPPLVNVRNFQSGTPLITSPTLNRNHSLASTQSPFQTQFFLGMGNAYAGIYSRCDFPLWMGWALIIYGTSITALFANFYFHAYISGKRLGGAERSKKRDGKKGEHGSGKHKSKSIKAQ